MIDYTNMTDDPLFDIDALDWTYSKRDGLVTLYCTEDLPDDEALQYINRAREAYSHVRTVFVTMDGEDALLDYCYGHQDFERIRRITGYLVGTLDRFNDGKRAEESERVKHRIG